MGKKKSVKTLKHSYTRYKRKCINNKVDYVPRVVYAKIISTFFKNVAIEILHAKTVNLGSFLGSICIKRHRMKYVPDNKMKIDFGTFKKEGVKAVHLNLHTNGFYYKFTWLKGQCQLKNKGATTFSPARDIKRTLAGILKDENRTIEYRG